MLNVFYILHIRYFAIDRYNLLQIYIKGTVKELDKSHLINDEILFFLTLNVVIVIIVLTCIYNVKNKRFVFFFEYFVYSQHTCVRVKNQRRNKFILFFLSTLHLCTSIYT